LSWNGRAGRWRGLRWTPRAKLCILPGPWQWELWNVDGEEGKARSEEAKEGRRRREGVRLPSSARCRLCRLCHYVTLQTMQFTWPCQKMACPVPALPMPSDTHRKPYVGRGCAGPRSDPHRVDKPLEHLSFNIQYSTVLPSPSLKATTVVVSRRQRPPDRQHLQSIRSVCAARTAAPRATRDDLHPARSITTLCVSSKVPIHERVLIVVPPHFR
jgi:hypothetical protein